MKSFAFVGALVTAVLALPSPQSPGIVTPSPAPHIGGALTASDPANRKLRLEEGREY
jgi:hypothetical protein